METERAHRACEKCTRTKKKCDKALPACSRCTRYVLVKSGSTLLPFFAPNLIKIEFVS